MELSEEALEFGRLARKALDAAGGDQIAPRTFAQPALRAELERPFAELGAWDLDVRGGTDELEAAAALCRATGWWGVPYPVAERLARPSDLGADGLVVLAEHTASAAVAHVDLRWAAVTLDGTRRIGRVAAPSGAEGSSLVAELELVDAGRASAVDVALGLVLPCWTLLGMLDRAMELTRAYVLERHQFGKPLASFQGLQFQLTEAEVERAGMEELAKYALWSIESGLPEVVDDALALRFAAVDAASVVMRIAHQLHGAIGFCDETTISWISRSSQPLREHPWGWSGSLDRLTQRVGSHGLTGIYARGPL